MSSPFIIKSNKIAGANAIVQNNLIQDSNRGIVVGGASAGTTIKNNTLQRDFLGIELLGAQGVIVNKNSVQAGGVRHRRSTLQQR